MKALRLVVVFAICAVAGVASAEVSDVSYTYPGHLGANRVDVSCTIVSTGYTSCLFQRRQKIAGVWGDYSDADMYFILSNYSPSTSNVDTEKTYGPYDPGDGFQIRWRSAEGMTTGAWNYFPEDLAEEPEPPAAPSTLVATTQSTSAIGLTWDDNASDETSQEVWMSEDGGAYTLHDTLSANTETLTVSGLDPATLYAFKIRAVRGSYQSTYSNIASATTDTPAVAAPTTFTATALSSARIKLAWVDTTGITDEGQETSFVLEHRAGTSGAFSALTTVAADVEQYTHTGLSNGTVHQYRLRSERTSPESVSEWIGPVEASTLGSDEEFSGSQPDGGFARWVSGDIATKERAQQIIAVQSKFFPAGNDSGMSPTDLKRGLVPCGSYTTSFRYTVRYADELTETSTEYTGGSIYEAIITVGRNGYITVSTSFVGNYGSPPTPWSPDYIPRNPGWDKNAKEGLTPGAVKAWAETARWTVKRELYTPYPDQYPPALLDEWDFYLDQHHTLATMIYDSMTGGQVDWQARFPRCPGENLDSYDLTGGSGGGIDTDDWTYSRTSSDNFFDDKFNEPSNLSRLRVMPDIDLDAEISSTYTIDGAGWWPGWSPGDASWSVDLRNPFGTSTTLSEAWDLIRLGLRSISSLLFICAGIYEAIKSLRQA
jgi:hypothetical protein